MTEDELYKKIARRVKHEVVSRGIKQAHLARELKISGASLSYCLNNINKFSLITLLKLEKIFNLPQGYFIYD